MAVAKTKPNVPVFVSSTFTDMQTYRRRVQEALTQLEAIVRGMEQFGSKPGSPVQECIQVVRSCRLYIGVFGMRYGSIPDGYDKSMTHLEYDEAQGLELPSLIHLLDENHPIPANDVEGGEGAAKLRALKEHLKKRHVVSFFTSPEDLQTRIMHDVPVQLDQMGVEVTDGLAKMEKAGDTEVLRTFAFLPKLFSGRQVSIEFTLKDLRGAMTEDCSTLGLEVGATVVAYNVPIARSGETLNVYGEREIALALLTVPKDSVVTARANTAFGERMDAEWTDDGPIAVHRSEKGLVVTEILSTTPSKP